MRISRRNFIVGTSIAGAAFAAPGIARAAAPEFKFKVGNISQADHPLNVWLMKARDKIAEETNGRVECQIFPSSQLGSETDMLSQVRSGAMECFAVSGITLSTLVPVAAINAIGFAFSDYSKVWQAMDGELGQHVKGQFSKVNLVALDKMWDNGFRQTTSSTRPIRTPDDMKGFKIRVPPTPLWTSMFKALDASPTSIPWGETYTALQTKVVDGLENPLVGIYFANMHEVQKYLAYTNHMWDGYWFVANARAWSRLPADLRVIVERNFNEAAVKQRVEVAKLNDDLRSKMSAKGLEFFDVNTAPFRERLQQSGFYKEWKSRYGEEAWALLEKVSGKLAG